MPAADRLLECLQHLLAPIGSGEDARRVWVQIYTTFIAPGVTDAVRAGYLRLAEEPQRRVESWLALLEAEGTLAPGDNRRGAWLLLTVIDGLSIHRALPAVDSPLEVETFDQTPQACRVSVEVLAPDVVWAIDAKHL